MTGTLLTTVEVSERLGLSSAAIAQAVRTGALQPTARTNDDFLFTERAVAAFAERRAEVAASPLEPPVAGSRSEWSGDVDRLNVWLKELTEALPSAEPAAPVEARPASIPAMEEPAIDFRPPPPFPEAGPEPVAAPPEPAAPLPAAKPEPAPTVAAVERERPVPALLVARSLLERIAAAQPATAEPPVIEPISAEPDPQPVAPAPAAVPETFGPPPEPEPVAAPPEPVGQVPEREPEPAPEPAPPAVLQPVPAPVAEVTKSPARPGSDLSRQAVLVVQPIVRFRVLREVTDRLATIREIADARLERLEGGVASYRLSFEGQRPSDEAIGEALAALNVEAILVDSFL